MNILTSALAKYTLHGELCEIFIGKDITLVYHCSGYEITVISCTDTIIKTAFRHTIHHGTVKIHAIDV